MLCLCPSWTEEEGMTQTPFSQHIFDPHIYAEMGKICRDRCIISLSKLREYVRHSLHK